jgi:hypothetical protein
MVSFFPPRHGRLLYACLEGGAVVIRKSAIYSFAVKNQAPFDLFAKVIYGVPLEEK